MFEGYISDLDRLEEFRCVDHGYSVDLDGLWSIAGFYIGDSWV